MEWFILLMVGIMYVVSTIMVYDKDIRNADYYLLAGATTGALVSLAWFIAAKIIDDKDRIFIYSLIWDGMLVLIFFFTPIVAFGIRLTETGLAGAILIISGIILLKLA